MKVPVRVTASALSIGAEVADNPDANKPRTFKVESVDICPGNWRTHIHVNRSMCYDTRAHVYVMQEVSDDTDAVLLQMEEAWATQYNSERGKALAASLGYASD